MLSAGDVSRLKTMSGWKPFAGRGQQLLLKVTAGPRKTAAGVLALANYVARAQGQGEHDHIELFDEMGEVIPVKDLKSVVRGWSLLGNNENLRPGARERVGQEDGLALLPEREKFWRNQAYHFVWSQTTEGTGLTEVELASRMREAAREFIFTEFAEREHQVLWGVHLDHPGRPHIHLIVKARSNGPAKTQLRLTPTILEDMRARLAKQARILDLPVHSERREDRPDLLRDILEGRAALRENVPRVAYDKDTSLAKQVPYWLSEEGQGWLRRKDRVAAIKKQSKDVPKQERSAFIKGQRPLSQPVKDTGRIPVEFHTLLACFAGIYSDPERALASYFKMVNGDGQSAKHKALAIWYLTRQPLAFGELVQGAETMLQPAAQAARACQTFPKVNWAKPPADLDKLTSKLTHKVRQRDQDRTTMLRGLGGLRHRLRLESVSSAHRDLVRNRMTEIRVFVPAQEQARSIPQPALQRVVDFIRPKRKPTR